jgi:hypothetical protein
MYLLKLLINFKNKLMMSKIIFSFLIIFFFLGYGIVEINKMEIIPKPTEINQLIVKFGSIQINNEKDIIKIQNLIVKSINHEFLDVVPLRIDSIVYNNKGFCYDRSFLLQKIFIYNKIPIRPLYIYFFDSGKNVSFFDIFDPSVNSHSIFEFRWKGEWYVMRTNTTMKELESLDQWIIKKGGGIFPSNVKYVRYLSNRNGKFLHPFWIPDIYYFN